jgi:predicted transcriptional regulator
MFNQTSGYMSEEKRLDLLFFELASEDRLSILRELCHSNLKMQELARKLDLTATEASRQLQRLNQEKLIERGSDGNYTTTQLGRLLLTLSTPLEFVYRHDGYFLNHDVTKIPLPFVNRLGELSQGTLVEDLISDLARWEALLTAAQEHIWVMTPRAMGHLTKISSIKLAEGVKIHSIMNEENRPTKNNLPSSKNAERRLIQEVPLIMIITEKEASVSFYGVKADVASGFASAFFGSDPAFLGWAKDLFLYYWAQAKLWV